MNDENVIQKFRNANRVERRELIKHNPELDWPRLVVLLTKSLGLLEFALKHRSSELSLTNDALFMIVSMKGKKRLNQLKRLIDFGYTHKEYPSTAWIKQTIQFRRLSRRLAIITLGAHRCRSLYRQPGFADICKIIARSVWSARFAGSEWE